MRHTFSTHTSRIFLEAEIDGRQVIGLGGSGAPALMFHVRLTMTYPFEQAGLGSPGVDELRWKRPVYPGDTLRCESEVFEKRRSATRPEMGVVKSKVRVFNQDDVVVLEMTSIGMVATRDQAPH